MLCVIDYYKHFFALRVTLIAGDLFFAKSCGIWDVSFRLGLCDVLCVVGTECEAHFLLTLKKIGN